MPTTTIHWYRVADLLPEIKEAVIAVWDAHGETHVGEAWMWKTGRWTAADFTPISKAPTHWAPMPTAPQE